MRCSTDQREGTHRQALQLSHSLCLDILTHQDHYSVLGKKKRKTFVVTSLVFLNVSVHFWSSLKQLPLGNNFVAGATSTVEPFEPFSTPHTHQLFFFLLLYSMANWENLLSQATITMTFLLCSRIGSNAYLWGRIWWQINLILLLRWNFIHCCTYNFTWLCSLPPSSGWIDILFISKNYWVIFWEKAQKYFAYVLYLNVFVKNSFSANWFSNCYICFIWYMFSEVYC